MGDIQDPRVSTLDMDLVGKMNTTVCPGYHRYNGVRYFVVSNCFIPYPTLSLRDHIIPRRPSTKACRPGPTALIQALMVFGSIPRQSQYYGSIPPQ